MAIGVSTSKINSSTCSEINTVQAAICVRSGMLLGRFISLWMFWIRLLFQAINVSDARYSTPQPSLLLLPSPPPPPSYRNPGQEINERGCWMAPQRSPSLELGFVVVNKRKRNLLIGERFADKYWWLVVSTGGGIFIVIRRFEDASKLRKSIKSREPLNA